MLVTGLLVAAGIAQGWDRAADVATVVAALAVAVLAVPLLVAAAGLRAVAAQPVRRRPPRGVRRLRLRRRGLRRLTPERYLPGTAVAPGTPGICSQVRVIVASQAGAPASWNLVPTRSGSMAAIVHPLPG